MLKLKPEFSFNLIGSQNAVHSAVQLGWDKFLLITSWGRQCTYQVGPVSGTTSTIQCLSHHYCSAPLLARCCEVGSVRLKADASARILQTLKGFVLIV